MRVILQDRTSGLYWRGDNDWTPNIAEASDFHQVLSAMEFAHQKKQPNLDILMTFGEPRYDVRIPLDRKAT